LALQISDNNVEAAVNKFYETDPSNLHKLLKDSVPRWDDTVFGSSSYGQDDTSDRHQGTWDLNQHRSTARVG
jgi:hypothetical protein